MGFWSRLLGKPETAKSAAGAAMVAYKTGQVAFKTTDPGSFAKEGYAGNSDVYACVDAIATAAKGIDWILYRARNEQSKHRATIRLKAARSPRQYRRAFRDLVKARVLVPVDGVHPLLELMARPNPQMDWTDLIEAIVGFYSISGNTFLHMNGPDEQTEEAVRPPLELWPLRPDKMDIRAGDALNPVSRFEYGAQGSKTILHPSHVLHFRKFNPLDDFWGMSPLQAAARRIDQMGATEEWNYQLTQNQAVPSGMFRTDLPLDEDQEGEVEDHARRKYLGPKNAGQPIISHGGEIDWIQMGLSPAEMHWIEGEKAGTRKICSVLGVAPEIIGDAQNKTYSNYAEARKALYQDTVLPLLDMIVSKLNAVLVPRFGDDLFLGYDVESIEALQEDRDKVWERVKGADFLTINDKRRHVGEEPIPGGDVVLVPAMMIPIGAVSATPIEEDEGKGHARDLQRKAFNLRSGDDKTEWWKAVERGRAATQTAVERSVQRVFQSEQRAVAAAIRNASEPLAATLAAQRAIDAHEKAWQAWLKATYLSVAETFADAVIGQIEKQAPSIRIERKAAGDVWQDAVLEHVGKVGGRKIKGIQDTTRTQVRTHLAEGVMEGESIAALAKRLDALYLEQIIPYRSTVIARTETIAASNLGSRAGAQATGLPLRKEWIATRDGRERDAHAEAEDVYGAEPIDLDEPYEVDGEPLMFPGDDSLGASAGNTIQCRCTEGYQVVGGYGGD